MIKWEQLTWYQKAAFWCVIGVVGWFAPEIALLFHFGGIEVVFAFIAVYAVPILRQLRSIYAKCAEVMTLAVVTYKESAAAQPRVFLLQASFCLTAFAVTGSVAFSAFFFMPALAFNGVLI